MEWLNELREIVERETAIPTFEKWIETTGYGEMSVNVSNPLCMRSVMVTLYARYRRTFGIK